MKLNKGDDTIVSEEVERIDAAPSAKRPRRSSLPETSTEKKDAEKDGEDARQSLADRIIERIRRALSPRSDGGRDADHDADDESESDVETAEQIDGKEIEVGSGDKDKVSKKDKDKKKRTKRLKKSKDKDKKLKAKKKKKPKATSKDKDDVSEKIEYAKEYPEDAPTDGEGTDTGGRPPKVKPEVVERVLATAQSEPPPVPDISPPKSPEHQLGVSVEGEVPRVDAEGQSRVVFLHIEIAICLVEGECKIAREDEDEAFMFRKLQLCVRIIGLCGGSVLQAFCRLAQKLHGD